MMRDVWLVACFLVVSVVISTECPLVTGRLRQLNLGFLHEADDLPKAGLRQDL